MTDLRALSDSLSAAGEHLAAVPLDVINGDRTELSTRFAPLIDNEDWNSLATEASAARSFYESRMEHLSEARETIVGAANLLPAAAEMPIPLPPTRRTDWPEFEGRLRAQLEANGSTPAEVAQAVAIVSELTWTDLRDPRNQVLASAAFMDYAAEDHLAKLIGSAIAEVVSGFNLAVSTTPEPTIEDDCRAAEERLISTERSLYESLKSNDTTATMKAARSLSQLVDADLARTGQQAATLAYDQRHSLALRFGALLRRQLRALALAHLVAWVSGWPPRFAVRAHWIRGGKNLPPGLDAIEVDSVALGEAVLHRAVGQRVTTEGFLEHVEEGRSPSPTLEARLRDSQGITTANVQMARLASAATTLNLGSWVRVTGAWRKTALAATPTDRWRLVVASPRSRPSTWHEWASRELRPICLLEPWGGAVSATWVPGRFGTAALVGTEAWYQPRDPTR